MESASAWEIAGYCSTVLVAIGCLGESIHDFTKWFQRGETWWKKHGGKLSAIVLIAALAAEVITQVRTNNINEQIIARLNLDRVNANLELERLKSKVAWRDISSEQSEQFKKLVVSAPKGRVAMKYLVNNEEAGVFTLKLAAMLKNAGYDVPVDRFRGMEPHLIFQLSEVGVVVHVAPEGHSIADPLIDALIKSLFINDGSRRRTPLRSGRLRA